ncbi:MAG TPA: hypothetical protein VHM19_22940 [Polyangiales bacterium]|jgi:hypothetical protein|nr:hypothetical protein [Polyangiales bacterium]
MPPALTIEDLASEVAKARGDAGDVKRAVLGDLRSGGLRERQAAVETRLNEQDRLTEHRLGSFETWFKHLDQRQATCEGLLLAMQARRPSSVVVGALVFAALAVAASAMFVARDTASISRDATRLVSIAIEQRAEQIADERAEERSRGAR